MAEYIGIIEVVEYISKKEQCQFQVLPRKRIMFRGTKTSGERITLCTPQSKLHPQGFYWIDITEKQKEILDETEKSLVAFRLEGRKLVIVKWEELKKYLTEECKKYNPKEKEHWKLNIYDDYIKISGNTNECKIQRVLD